MFKPGPQRRIVLATNVAETSLTVPRIRYVIDTGTARVKRYSQRNQLERLHIEPISQAAADQRKGRCGRVGPGVCYRLYDEDEFASAPRYTDPEILRSSLAGVILRMLALQARRCRGVSVRRSAVRARDRATAIAGSPRSRRDRRRSAGSRAIGRTLAQAADRRRARRACWSRRETARCVARTARARSFLSIQDPRERPADARQAADQAHAVFADPKSDFVGVLKLWSAYTTRTRS